MEEEYLIILSEEENMTKVLEQVSNQTKYEIIAQDKYVLMISKSPQKIQLEKSAIELIISIARKQRTNDVTLVDITKIVQYILNGKEDIDYDTKLSWMIRQAITKALSQKKK